MLIVGTGGISVGQRHLRYNQLMGRRWLVLVCLLAAACEGDIDSGSDGPGRTDLYVYPDTTVADTSPATDLPGVTVDGPKGDGPVGPPGDTGPGSDALGPCASWANWTCQTDAVYLCKASCQVGGQTLMLSCLNSGHCACGISTGPCGQFTGAQPCDTCQQALQNGCCK